MYSIPYLVERMIEEPVSVISVLSVTAIITTVSLFFCGIPICLEIWNRKSTDEISGFPFLMGFLGGSFWLRYGLLKFDLTMIIVNVVGVSLMFLYLIFYLYYTKSKMIILLELTVVLSAISAMLALVEIYGETMIDSLGFVCMTFNIINFGAPLAGIAVVFRKRSCDTLPLPLCTANLLVSFQWFIYGLLVSDKYICIPNGAGIVLALLQISLFLIFPRRPGTRAPLAACFRCVADLERAEKPELSGEAGLMTTQMRCGMIGPAPCCWSYNRQRIYDRSAVPPSRVACIEYLRSPAFNAGGYYYATTMVNEVAPTVANATANATLVNPSVGGGIPNNTSSSNLNRLSSISHPELWELGFDASQNGPSMSNVGFGDSMVSRGPNESGLFNVSQTSNGGFFNTSNFSRYYCPTHGNHLRCHHWPMNNGRMASSRSRQASFGHSHCSNARGGMNSSFGSAASSSRFDASVRRSGTPSATVATESTAITMGETEASEAPPPPCFFEFKRIREIDELDEWWLECEVRRAMSAPDLVATPLPSLLHSPTAFADSIRRADDFDKHEKKEEEEERIREMT